MTERKNKIRVLNRQADGFTAITTGPTPVAPWRETTCRTCGAPKTAHDANCPEDNDVLSKHEVATLGAPPFDHVHDPATCRHCQDMRLLRVRGSVSQDPTLLIDLHAFLYNLGTIELFRCSDCRCPSTEFIDSECAERYEALLKRLTKALEAK